MDKFIETILRAAKEENDRREAEAAKLVADPMAEAKVDAIAAEFERVDKDFFMKNERHNLLPRMAVNGFTMENADELIGLITYAARALLKVAEFTARLDTFSDSFKVNQKLGKKADDLTLHMMEFGNIVNKMLDDMLDAFHHALDLDDGPVCNHDDGDEDDDDEVDPYDGSSGCMAEEPNEPDDMAVLLRILRVLGVLDAALAKAKT